jgi:hypothetical protein
MKTKRTKWQILFYTCAKFQPNWFNGTEVIQNQSIPVKKTPVPCKMFYNFCGGVNFIAVDWKFGSPPRRSIGLRRKKKRRVTF